MNKKIIAILLSISLLLGAICFNSFADVADETAATAVPDPIAFWNFESVDGTTLKDVTGNGHNGTLMNAPAFTEGKCGTAISFDGTNQYVQFPYAADLDFSNNDSFTLSLWVKTMNSTTQWQLLAGNGRASKANWYGIYYKKDNTFRLSAQTPYVDAQIASNVQETWQHLAIAYSASDKTFYMYANGKLTGTKKTTPQMSNGADYGFLLGCSGEAVGEYFKGLLDNVRVHNVTLSAEQIKLMYDTDNCVTGDSNEDGVTDICDLVLTNLGADGKTAELNNVNADFDKNGSVEAQDVHLLRNSLILDDSLVAFYDFETVSGSTLVDVSGNGHNGTLINSPTVSSGKNGNSIHFNGSDQYVYFDYDADLEFSAAESFTLSMWVKPDGKSGWQMLAGNGRESGTNGNWYGIYFYGSTSTYSFARRNSYQSVNIGTHTATELSNWKHIAAVYDGTHKKINLYLNGELTNSVDANDAVMENGGLYGFALGCSSAAIGEYFKGSLDNVRVYNRSLSESEINKMYSTEEAANPEVLPEVKEYVKYEGAWPDPSTEVANIIFDTDMGPDYDDTAATIMLHNYADQGKANILAMGCSSSSAYGAAFLDLINTYYGRPDIPVGALKSRSDILPTCRGYNFSITTFAKYETDILDAYHAPDVVKVYREALAKAEDSSVTIVITGMMTNMYDLLCSKPDEYSDLSGMELVSKKVKLVSAMAGQWPTTGSAEFNLSNDTVAAAYVADNCPVPIMFSGYEIGKEILTGYRTGDTAEDNPLITAYHSGQRAWDLTSVLYAVEGLGEYWTMVRGDADIVEGCNSFTVNNTTGARAYLVKKMDPEEIAAILDKYMITPKKNNPDEVKVKGIDSANATMSGTWATYKPHEFFYEKSTQQSTTANSSLTFNFSGDGVDIYGGMTTYTGKIAIYIDDVLVDTVDTYDAVTVDSRLLYTNHNLTKADHTLKIVVLDEKNDLSSGIGATIDFVKIINCD